MPTISQLIRKPRQPKTYREKARHLEASPQKRLFTAEEVAVVEGGPQVAAAVTKLPLDHLFFTGSTQVGLKVADGRSFLNSLAVAACVAVGVVLLCSLPAYALSRFGFRGRGGLALFSNAGSAGLIASRNRRLALPRRELGHRAVRLVKGEQQELGAYAS